MSIASFTAAHTWTRQSPRTPCSPWTPAGTPHAAFTSAVIVSPACTSAASSSKVPVIVLVVMTSATASAATATAPATTWARATSVSILFMIISGTRMHPPVLLPLVDCRHNTSVCAWSSQVPAIILNPSHACEAVVGRSSHSRACSWLLHVCHLYLEHHALQLFARDLFEGIRSITCVVKLNKGHTFGSEWKFYVSDMTKLTKLPLKVGLLHFGRHARNEEPSPVCGGLRPPRHLHCPQASPHSTPRTP
mmetsp:Transcript_38821/g.76972  ORF Transcript_38821/g.76972 Transcript_38821/m.76972 type:complete len:249 (-) Transcript_38821:17-763(-)